jgi:hypothetical protein
MKTDVFRQKRQMILKNHISETKPKTLFQLCERLLLIIVSYYKKMKQIDFEGSKSEVIFFTLKRPFLHKGQKNIFLRYVTFFKIISYGHTITGKLRLGLYKYFNPL